MFDGRGKRYWGEELGWFHRQFREANTDIHTERTDTGLQMVSWMQMQ